MPFFSDNSPQAQASQQFAQAPNHEASISHELIAAATAYEAAKCYERYKESSGKPQSHEQVSFVFPVPPCSWDAGVGGWRSIGLVSACCTES